MKEPLDLAYSLLTKADHDYRAAEIGIENDAPLDTAAFHLQQAAEKLIKAFLNWKQVQYPKTHALGALLDLAVAHDASLEDFRDRLLAMASYAVEMRYDDELYPTFEEVSAGLQMVTELRQKIVSLLPPQTKPPLPPLSESQ